jgi:peptidyl-dipeptidase A
MSVAGGEDGILVENANRFIESHLAWYEPLATELGRAAWLASISGEEEDFQKSKELKDKLDAKLADPVAFGAIEAIYNQIDAIGGEESTLGRQILLLYFFYMPKQVDPVLLRQITELESNVEKSFNTYRAKVDAAELTDNEIRDILRSSVDCERRRRAWEGSKGVGKVVEKDLRALVAARNEAARKAGFQNFQQMSLEMDEHNPDKLLALFDELDELTRDSFLQAKAEMDRVLARRYDITSDELRAWHYEDPFFQEPPNVYNGGLDALYEKKDLAQLTNEFFASIGLPVSDIVVNSSLYPQEGKSQHAYCTDIDRQGDVRVLANIAATDYWMSTMLHEFGHGIYFSSYVPRSLPFLLRGPAHTLTTEGVAMLMGRLPRRVQWLEDMNLVPDEAQEKDAIAEVAQKLNKNGLLVFSRWAQVMFRFEKALYESPDADLSTIWWDLVEKYQAIPRPEGRDEPDWASKIHVAVAPVYYHNYQLGELWASQVMHAAAREFTGGDLQKLRFTNNTALGEFLIEKVIQPGNTMPWNALTKFATGEELNAKAYAKDVSNQLGPAAKRR